MSKARRWYLIPGLLLVGAVFAVAIFAEQLTTFSPYYMDYPVTTASPKPPFPPGDVHPLGTDWLGRDLWSQIAYGARWSLLFAFLIMAARLAVAMPVALLAAFGPKAAGWLLSRLYIWTNALPPLAIYIFILGVPRLRLIGFWPSAVLTVLLLTLMEFPRLAVSLKGRLEELAAEPFVEGAIAAGASRHRILAVHLLPHLWPTLLHLMAAEMGRGLLTIAQMGIFGIWVSGGVTERVPDGDDSFRLTTAPGVPEWGSMLAAARYFIHSAPWIALAPAFSFFVGVLGFNLLSQGLEGAHISLIRLREMTTGRLPARWRWALLPIPLVLALWYWQGLPGGRYEGVHDLAARQSALLTARDLDGFMATLAPGQADYRAELRRWLSDELANPALARVAVEAHHPEIRGARAAAGWAVRFEYEGGRVPLTYSREVELVRRFGTWYEARERYTTVRGRSVNVSAVYEPHNAREEAMARRSDVRRMAVAADHAYQRLATLFPGDPAAGRPHLRMYRSAWDYRRAVAGDPIALADPGMLRFIPGEPLRVSPELVWLTNGDEMLAPLTYALLQEMTWRNLGMESAHPIATGLLRLELEYQPINLWQWAGHRLLSIDELYATPLTELTPMRQAVYSGQSALLVEFLSRHIERERLAPSLRELKSPAALAAALGTTPDRLAVVYDAFAGEYLAAKAPLPPALASALAERAEARRGAPGLARYEAAPVHIMVRETTATLYLLEKTSVGESGIAQQEWALRDGAWVLQSERSPF